MKKQLIMLSMILIIVFSVQLVSASLDSNLQFSYEASDWSLPWYPVQQWEVNTCTQHLSTELQRNDAGNVFQFNARPPVYLDTLSLVAIKKPTYDGYYYEVGWYVQPFSGNMKLNITLEGEGRSFNFYQGSATEDQANNGYEAFAIPCDPEYYSCKPIDVNITAAKIVYWHYNETTDSVTGETTIGEFGKDFIKTRFVVGEGFN